MLVFYLVGIGLDEPQIGLLLTLTLLGDTVVSLALTTRADRFGRRRTLIAGAALMAAAGFAFASTRNLGLLLLAGTLGVISPSGQEVGPFLSIEQAALAHVTTERNRTETFAWYTLAGSIATACGALVAGRGTRVVQALGVAPVGSYRLIVIAYAVSGLLLAAIFMGVSRSIEVRTLRSGLDRSRGVVLKLSALFALDSFGGGFVIQSFAAYWFHLRFHVDPATLGAIFFWANILAGLSALAASRLASRIGLVETMVVTHLPSNVLLILIPLMPTLSWAVALLLVRFSISQMDVPTRQSFVMAVVPPEERSAAAGVTGVARTIGASISPLCVGVLFAHPALIDVPFFIAGALKIVYDISLYRSFTSASAGR